ncbi:ABC transporter permease [Bacteroides sp. OttesenSCG-928-N06]|nr:ABC transporter permease [Bacteroides sp. OttesenSCG-928-N06]
MIKYLIEKEFKQLRRNPFLPKLIVGFTCMMMLVMPFAANQEVKDLNVCIIDHDHSTFSRRLVQKIEASSYFNLSDVVPVYEQALESIEYGKCDVILEISSGFEKDIITGNPTEVMISANAVNGMKGGLGTSYLSAILNDFSVAIGDELRLSAPSPGIKVSTQTRFNPHQEYKVFMIPALMVMVLTLLCGFLPALNIVGEKEVGTIEQINVTPVGRFTFILSKLIPYWIIGFAVLTLCFALAALLYDLKPVGSLWVIYLFAVVYVLVVSALGLVVSNYSATMQQAMFVVFFFIIIFIIMSGLFTPVNSMPAWAQAITVINPLKYFMEVMRAVYLKGSGINELSRQMIALVGFALVFNLLAVVSYKKRG